MLLMSSWDSRKKQGILLCNVPRRSLGSSMPQAGLESLVRFDEDFSGVFEAL
jgi:hypothetical protein